MAQEEPLPVHETVKALEGVTISKSGKWWSAALRALRQKTKQKRLHRQIRRLLSETQGQKGISARFENTRSCQEPESILPE